MKILRATFIIAAIAAAFVLVPAKAQLTPATTTTIIVNAATVSNTPIGLLTIDVRRQRNIAIKWSSELSGSGSDTNGLRFFPSVDGSTLPTTPSLATGYYISTLANGTTRVDITTNFDTLGYPYLMLAYITNGSAAQVLTNRISWWTLPAVGK